MTAIAGLKRAHRATWAAGDHAAVAEDIDHVPPAHPLRRVPITLGDNVLDVAAGTGNATIRAAQAGAAVVGLELTPELFAVARERPWRFASADDMITLFETNCGPTVKARARLEPEGTWDACRRDLVAVAGLLVRAEYLVTVGTKAD